MLFVVLLFKNSFDMFMSEVFILSIIMNIFSVYIVILCRGVTLEVRYNSIQAIISDLLFVLQFFIWSLSAVEVSKAFQGVRIPISWFIIISLR